MIEILKGFEQVAVRFSPAVLVAPGIAMVMLGLLTWLAGTCLPRVVLGLFGAGVGALASFFLGTHHPLVFGVAAWIGAVLGAVLPRVFITVLLAVLGMAIAFVILARAQLLASPGTLPTASCCSAWPRSARWSSCSSAASLGAGSGGKARRPHLTGGSPVSSGAAGERKDDAALVEGGQQGSGGKRPARGGTGACHEQSGKCFADRPLRRGVGPGEG
jgi:hypothetical protein